MDWIALEVLSGRLRALMEQMEQGDHMEADTLCPAVKREWRNGMTMLSSAIMAEFGQLPGESPDVPFDAWRTDKSVKQVISILEVAESTLAAYKERMQQEGDAE